MYRTKTAHIKFSLAILVGVVAMCEGLFVPTARAATVVISNVTVTSITDTSAIVSWKTDLAGDTWVGFVAEGTTTRRVEQSLASTTDHVASLSNLTPGTKYTYEVNTQTFSGDVGFIVDLAFTTTGQKPGGGVTGSAQPCGVLAKSGSAIYFLTGKDKVKIPFTSMAAFSGLGYDLKNVKTMDVSGYKSSGSYYLSSPTQEHPWCSWMKWKDGTIYYSHPTGSIPVPSWEVFTNNGGRADLIVPMNTADDAIWAVNPNLPVLQLNDSRIL